MEQTVPALVHAVFETCDLCFGGHGRIRTDSGKTYGEYSTKFRAKEALIIIVNERWITDPVTIEYLFLQIDCSALAHTYEQVSVETRRHSSEINKERLAFHLASGIELPKLHEIARA